ncbi:MAG: hemerythrin domain-containing protein [Myxococcaceae bacterium]|jgi:iron-sulfur cluster repair protein YtfE (RIC family)|nr:hemerythrin domain-containing protein [Myxococcaceae bacterium]MCA3016985.1 hemerythrin domain-containing protein [Myxococcaceae bacterium]
MEAVSPDTLLDDVVEEFLQAHAHSRAALALAERLASSPADASTSAVAQRVADTFERHLEVHFADEEATLTPRLQGRVAALDRAIATMRLEHVALHALVSRVTFLTRLIARDPQRLLSVRFELMRAADDLRLRLVTHQALEESLLFPAVKRLLTCSDVEAMRAEMTQRRALASD